MKGLLDKIENYDRSRVLGIDPSSNALAFCLIEDGKPVAWMKLVFHRKSDIQSKLKMIKTMIDIVIEEFGDISLVCIEQMVMVQNALTTRILTYISGSIMYEFIQRGYDVIDVPPLVWKAYMGYKNVTKK